MAREEAAHRRVLLQPPGENAEEDAALHEGAPPGDVRRRDGRVLRTPSGRILTKSGRAEATRPPLPDPTIIDL